MTNDDLGRHPASTVLAESGPDQHTYGVTRVLSSQAGSPGEEREYEVGDEALVEAGLAEWVVAPVFEPAAGRRHDDASREPTPLGGIEAFPVAEPTTPARRAEARPKRVADAHVDEGLGEKLAAKRRDVARGLSDGDEGDDAKTQAGLGSLGARSGPVTARSDLAADKQLAAASDADATRRADKSADKSGK